LQSDCVKLVDEKSTISSIPHIYMHHMGRFYQSQLLYSSQQRVHGSVNKVVFAICFTRGFNLKCGLHVSDTIVKPAMHAEACGNYSSDTSVTSDVEWVKPAGGRIDIPGLPMMHRCSYQRLYTPAMLHDIYKVCQAVRTPHPL
jgi:hypothetical protein